jgi:hypothetical protein
MGKLFGRMETGAEAGQRRERERAEAKKWHRPEWILTEFHRENAWTEFWWVRCRRCGKKKGFTKRKTQALAAPAAFVEDHSKCEIRAKKTDNTQSASAGSLSGFSITHKRSTNWADYSRITCLRCGEHQDYGVSHGDPDPNGHTARFREEHQNCIGKERKPMKPWRRPAHKPAEDLYLTKVAALGCYCCHVDDIGWVTPDIHHPRADQGMSQRAEHGDAMPLCKGHHQGDGDPSKLAFHQSRKAWESRYGTEDGIVHFIQSVIAKLDATVENWWEFGPEITSRIPWK